MMFSYIKQSEIESFFCEAYGYNTISDSFGTYIFSLEKKGFGFIYLTPRKAYWKPALWLWLKLDQKLLNDSFPLTWAKFSLHVEINRATMKQSKSK